MSAHPGPISGLVAGLLWPDEPVTRTAILLLLGLAALAFVSVYGPFLRRLFRIGQLRRTVQACFDDESSNAIQRQEVTNAFAESPLAPQWSDFVRRWHNAIAADPIQDASLPELSRAPVRLTDVLEEHPILPAGARRSLLPALPAIFLAAGLLGAFAGLVLTLPDIGLSLDPGSHETTGRSQQIATLMDHLGMTLRVGLWGLLLSLAAGVTGRLIEGRADLQADALDGWVQLAYGAISTGELATRTAHEQRASLARLQEDMAELLRQASGRPRPFVRSSGGAAGGPSAASESLERDLSALGERIAQRLDDTVSEQLAALRESVGGALERLGSAPTSSSDLALAVDHLVKSAESQSAAGRSLTQTAHLLSDAAEELRSGLDDFASAVTQVRESSATLALSSQRVDGNQAAASRAAEALASSLERTEAATREQAERLQAGFAEVRDVVESATTRVQAELESALASAVGRFRDTAMPATPPGGYETSRDAMTDELLREHAQLHQKADGLAAAVAKLNESLASLSALSVGAGDPEGPGKAGAERPRQGPRDGFEDAEPLLDLDEETVAAEATGPQATSAPEPEGAAGEPQVATTGAGEAERPVTPQPAPPSSSAEADTVPYMKAPTPEMIYSAGEHRSGAAAPETTRVRSDAPGAGTLSGLLRPTHHSGPSASQPEGSPPVDPAATVRIEPRTPAPDADADDRDAEDATPRPRGFFGRRK